MADEGTALTNEPTPTDTASNTWREALPEEIREAGSLKDIPDVNTLAKSYVDAQSFIGRSIRIPGEDASDEVRSEFNAKLTEVPGVGRIPTEESSSEDWGTFYNQLGRPQSVDDYKIERPENLPGDPEAERGFLEKMHEVGLNNKQASELINWMHDGNQNVTAEMQETQDRSLQALKTEWGQAFDQKLGQARNALQAYGDDDLVEMLNNTGLGDSPSMIKAFAKIGEGLTEDAALNLGGSQASRNTPAEAWSQINEIIGNAAHPYNDANHPAHNAEVDRVARLYQAAYQSSDDSEPAGEFERRFESAFNAQATG